MKELNPELKITEISKVLGDKWGKMDAEAKAPYNELAQADKERCVADQFLTTDSRRGGRFR